LGEGKKLYYANKEVYRLLRYGIKDKEGTGQQKQTIWLIDWANPENNDFAIAEEVSVKGENKKLVFVDECHRTQSGALHEAMKEILPNALFIGYTSLNEFYRNQLKKCIPDLLEKWQTIIDVETEFWGVKKN